MILLYSMYEKTYLSGFLEVVLEAIQEFSVLQYLYSLQMVGSPLQSFSLREKDDKRENSHKAFMGTFSCGHFPLIYRHLACRFFMKTLIIISIFPNIYRPYVCDPLSLYISLVNNYTGLITPYWSILINYYHQHID